MAKVSLYFLVAVIFVLGASQVYAATIEGTVYSFSLEEIKNAKIEINTTPAQVFVAKNSTYRFNVPFGYYEINVTYRYTEERESTKEYITIKDDGEYLLDLILFPNSEEELNESVDFEKNILNESKDDRIIILGIIFLIILLAVFVFSIAKTKIKLKSLIGIDKSLTEIQNDKNLLENQSDYDLEKIISVIKEEGGRTTQKDIRKKIPYSEAKISLMLAELEHEGKIKKIKKGRGNIIILNK